jgi:hypothetical protein
VPHKKHESAWSRKAALRENNWRLQTELRNLSAVLKIALLRLRLPSSVLDATCPMQSSRRLLQNDRQQARSTTIGLRNRSFRFVINTEHGALFR